MNLRACVLVVPFALGAWACSGGPQSDPESSGPTGSGTSGTSAGGASSSSVTTSSNGTVTSGADGSTVTTNSSSNVSTTTGTVTTTGTDGTTTTGTVTTTGVATTTGGGGSGGGPATPQPNLVTSAMGNYWVEGELVEGGGAATVTVDTGTTYQEWLGFGGTFNEAGWDALAVLDAATRDYAIQLLFSDTQGAGLDWGRIPIGASDYALSRYTLAETPNDLTMQDFSIERDRQMLIPYIKAAQAVKSDIKFWGSPWSPPAWMKDSNDINGTDANGSYQSNMLSDPSILQAHALYFARFIEEYQAEGIPIDHVQPQNEPGYATRYPSCLWSAGLLGTFVGDYLGPTLAERGLSAGIWFGTLSNADTYSGHINGLNGSAAQYVTGVGLQWNTMNNTQTLSNQGYLVMQTEHKCGNYPWETATFNPDSPPNDHAYGEESWGLIRDWLQAGVHIYSAWNMVLDTQGQNLDEQRPWPQNALLAVNRGTSELIVTPAFHVFRHFSQFVDPGAVRVAVSGGDALAFQNPDSSIVTVLYNSDGQDSATTLAVGGTSVEFTIPARGWATVNWEG